MKISVLGTGLLGEAIALRLLNEGYDLIVYNRTDEKTTALVSEGARHASSPEEAIETSEILILVLSDFDAIREVFLNKIPGQSLSGKTVIQMGTILPAKSKELDRFVCDAGAEYLEAPVLGSRPEAKSGALIVMAGCTDTQFGKWTPFFRSLSREPVHAGEVGKAAALKLALNQLIASLTTAFSLSLGLVLKNGIDAELFMGILRDSALYAPTFDKKLHRMLERNYSDPNFPTRHLLKDIILVREAAAAAGLEGGILEELSKICRRAIDMGLGESDYSSIFNAVDPPED